MMDFFFFFTPRLNEGPLALQENISSSNKNLCGAHHSSLSKAIVKIVKRKVLKLSFHLILPPQINFKMAVMRKKKSHMFYKNIDYVHDT